MPLRYGLPEFSLALKAHFPKAILLDTTRRGFPYRRTPDALLSQSSYCIFCSVREARCQNLDNLSHSIDYPQKGKPEITDFSPRPRFKSCTVCPWNSQ
jgi:hypothetical protein